MRRKDREVTDKKEILEMLEKCDTVRIGIRGAEYPYVVPVSFGMAIENEEPVIYFHCAKQGMKLELLQEHAEVCVEGDRFLGVQKTAHGITTRYESVIGFGKCQFVEMPEEVEKGIQTVLAHYGYHDYPLDRCKGLDHMKVGRIRLERLYGKRNLPEKE